MGEEQSEISHQEECLEVFLTESDTDDAISESDAYGATIIGDAAFIDLDMDEYGHSCDGHVAIIDDDELQDLVCGFLPGYSSSTSFRRD